MIFFKDINNPPPGGFYCEVGGDRVTASTFVEMTMKMRPLLSKHRITKPLEVVVAEFMAPRTDNAAAYFTGADLGTPRVSVSEAFDNSKAYLTRNLVPFDRLSRRYEVCLKCPMHKRDWCPTCTGHPKYFDLAFKGARTRVPEDRVSGVCQCAKAYEYVINAVEYSPDEKVWPGAPETCWRNHNV